MPLPQINSEPAELAHRRRHLREAAIAARVAMPASQRSILMGAIETRLAVLLDRLAPQTLGFCWPFRGEPDLRAFVTGWLGADPQRQAALPVVLDKAAPMVFRAWQPDMQLGVDRHGIPMPLDGLSLIPDVVLVPLNAFDAAGFRLGYGGGYFDRTLAMIDSIAVGVGFESGRVDSIYPQAHDRPMAWIVTESGTFAPSEDVSCPETSDTPDCRFHPESRNRGD